MDGYQFTAAIVHSIVSLAWPLALVAAAWMFRDKITDLLPLLRFKYKDIDVSFRLDDAEKKAESLPAPAEPSEPTPEEADKFNKLLRISPRAAIMERRAELEDALVTYAVSRGLGIFRAGLLNLTRDLRRDQLIDEATSAVLDDLRVVGNRAAHDITREISESDAKRFRDLSDKVIQHLQFLTAAANMPPPGPIPHGG